MKACRAGSSACRHRYLLLPRSYYHVPVFGIDAQGSCLGLAPPFCRSSIEMLSGERTKAALPSRGGRLIVTPCLQQPVADRVDVVDSKGDMPKIAGLAIILRVPVIGELDRGLFIAGRGEKE